MKKIIATLLLLIFTSNIATFAGEAITNNQNDKFISQTENQEIKINIKDIDVNNPDLIKYHTKFKKYSQIETSYFFTPYIDKDLKGYKYYNYPEIDNFDLNNKNIIRVELQDGDYAILNNNIKGKKKYKYAAEYHKDGSLFGIVQIKTIKKTRKSATLAFYEYRLDNNKEKYYNEHIMYLDIEKQKNKVNVCQFIYKNDNGSPLKLKDLICCQINNDLYLNKNSKNLIVKMKKFNIPSETNATYCNIKNTTKDIVVGVITIPFAAIGIIILSPLIIWLFYEIDKNGWH